MSAKTPLDVQTLLAESEALPGALGAVAYVVLKGLQVGGADPKVVASVRLLMQQHFEKLSDADCNALCDTLYARLQRQAGQRWY